MAQDLEFIGILNEFILEETIQRNLRVSTRTSRGVVNPLFVQIHTRCSLALALALAMALALASPCIAERPVWLTPPRVCDLFLGLGSIGLGAEFC